MSWRWLPRRGAGESRAPAERLTAPLAARLVLLEALSAAAYEITRDLAPGSFDLRLRGGDSAFVVTRPPTDESFDGTVEVEPDVASRGTVPAPADVERPARPTPAAQPAERAAIHRLVRPSDGSNENDVNAAEQTRVEYSHGSLSIKAPKQWRYGTPRVDARARTVHGDIVVRRS